MQILNPAPPLQLTQKNRLSQASPNIFAKDGFYFPMRTETARKTKPDCLLCNFRNKVILNALSITLLINQINNQILY